MKKFLILILTFAMATAALAATRDGVNSAYPWGMRSVAALGMGDAFYVKSDNKYAPFYNPAGLANVKTGKVDIIPLMITANMETVNFVGDVIGLDFNNDTEVANMLKDYIGEPLNGQFQMYPSYTRPFFTVGLFTSASVNASASNPVLPELNLDATANAGFVIGGAFAPKSRGFWQRLQLGAAGKFYYNIREQDTFTFMELSKDDFDVSWDTMNKGYVFDVDLGAIYNFYEHGLKPRVGFAVNNIAIVETDGAEANPTTLNLSAGISPSFLKEQINTDFIIDIRDVTFAYDDNDLGKRINLGAEFRFLEDRLALRAGIHQGYLTLGAGVDLWLLTVDYAYYKEELGAYSGQNPDTRHAIEVNIGF
jgi:hypothetical protein